EPSVVVLHHAGGGEAVEDLGRVAEVEVRSCGYLLGGTALVGAEPVEKPASVGNSQDSDGGSTTRHRHEPIEERLDAGPVHQATIPPMIVIQARSVAGR